MHASAVFATVSLLMAGCAGPQIEAGMNQLMGQPVASLIAVLGYPDAEGSVAGRKVYVWSNQSQETLILPETNYTTGFVAGQPVTLQNTQFVPTNLNFSCRIRAIVNDQDIIESWDYRGNQGGCAPYARRLNQVVRVAASDQAGSAGSDWSKGYAWGVKLGAHAGCATSASIVKNPDEWTAGCEAGRKDKP